MRERWKGHRERRWGKCGKRRSHLATRKRRGNIRGRGEKFGQEIKGGQRSGETIGWKEEVKS